MGLIFSPPKLYILEENKQQKIISNRVPEGWELDMLKQHQVPAPGSQEADQLGVSPVMDWLWELLQVTKPLKASVSVSVQGG